MYVYQPSIYVHIRTIQLYIVCILVNYTCKCLYYLFIESACGMTMSMLACVMYVLSVWYVYIMTIGVLISRIKHFSFTFKFQRACETEVISLT